MEDEVLVAFTAELVSSYVSNNKLREDQYLDLIAKTYWRLRDLLKDESPVSSDDPRDVGC